MPDGMQWLLQTHPTPLTHICLVQQMHLVSDCSITYFGSAATCQEKKGLLPWCSSAFPPSSSSSSFFLAKHTHFGLRGGKINKGGRGVIHGENSPMAFAFYLM